MRIACLDLGQDISFLYKHRNVIGTAHEMLANAMQPEPVPSERNGILSYFWEVRDVI